MPSLADTLAHLAHQSDQITALSAQNDRPTGPYVEALLHTPSVLQLIRDAHESETRLFKFIGEESSGAKKVEKRDGSIVTPLKTLKRDRAGSSERDLVGAMLRTAMKLVDDYHPMPRARAHIQNLLDAHQKQAERVAELERLINEATSGTTEPPAPTTVAKSTKPPRSVEQAIQSEEKALRRLETSLASLRQTATPADTPSHHTLPPRSPSPPASQPLPSQTPAKTPSSMPHISNSLVNGSTPRRPVQSTINRFSPLKFLGTPRAPVGRSGLRNDAEEDEGRSTLFGGLNPRASTSYRQSVLTTSAPGPQLDDRDETVRFAPQPVISPQKVQTPATPNKTVTSDADVSMASESTPRASPAKDALGDSQKSESGGIRPAHNVDLDREGIKEGSEKIWSAMPEMMRQGVKDGTTVGEDVESTVKHIYHLSQSDPPPPPSPSNASTLSSLSSVASGPKAPPITNQTILIANLLLMLLQSPDGSVSVHDLKESLGTLARARGWEGGEGLATKVLYLAVGKRIVRIDRRGGGGGKVTFAV